MVKLNFGGTKFVAIALVFIAIWLFGGANFIFANPVIIVFGILALILMMKK